MTAAEHQGNEVIEALLIISLFLLSLNLLDFQLSQLQLFRNYFKYLVILRLLGFLSFLLLL